MTKGKIVDHLSLIVIDSNNRCWKPRFLYVTLAVVTLHLDRYMLMMGVMAYSPTHTDGAHTPGGALDGLVDDVEMAPLLDDDARCIDGAPVADDGPLLDDDAHMIDG